ncbi:ATP-binding protein [Rubrivivax gelatinosus]|uniref:DNA-binding winged helix-turn-helix (WHTH) protein n=1 Tax=Rubrivivax gelatinosus TaxID=28068 RepID=A0A4V2SH99_RUBGE|nr:winged helix-turn-helix domain-containing protein [Rubrivivax gelatinosus]TCP04298.1 DNA-binding winged helix-turn-helix (wHTH) protein [Rubrivivax gelatinosus]
MSPRARVAHCTIDFESRRLLLDGEPARLGPRSFDLLVTLLEGRSRVISRAELIERVWPGPAVEDHALSAQVSLLRKLLGPGSISTVAGRGYQLVCEVEELVDEPDGLAPSSRVMELPAGPAGFVGRVDEQQALTALLQQARLVCVCGPGGVGKTALALRVAQERRRAGQAVLWVEVGVGCSVDEIAASIADRLGVPQTRHVGPLPAVLAALRQRPALLVLDGAEACSAAVYTIVDQLAGAAALHVLVVSQTALHHPQECVMALAGLALPAEQAARQALVSGDAMRLFLARAGLGDGRDLDFLQLELAARVCRQVGGSALAIRLLASRLRRLGGDGLPGLLHLKDTSQPASRQTLLATLQWSYRLLPPLGQLLLRRLAWCVRGFSFELALAIGRQEVVEEAVHGALDALIDCGLVAVDAGEPLRFRLPEPIRQFVLLQEPLPAHAAEVHARALLAVYADADEARLRCTERAWRRRYEPDLDNLLAALRWASVHDAALAYELLGATPMLFSLLYRQQEFLAFAQRTEALVPAARLAPAALARHKLALARVQTTPWPARAVAPAQEALALLRELGDPRAAFVAQVLLASIVDGAPQRLAEAQAMLPEIVAAAQQGFPPLLARYRFQAEALVYSFLGRTADALVACRCCAALAREAGWDFYARSDLSNLAYLHLEVGDTAEAIRIGEELAALHRGAIGSQACFALGNHAHALLRGGRLAEARAALETYVEVARASDWASFEVLSAQFALFAAREGRLHAAAFLLGYADRCVERGARRFSAYTRSYGEAAECVRQGLAGEVAAHCRRAGGEADQHQVVVATLDAGDYAPLTLVDDAG